MIRASSIVDRAGFAIFVLALVLTSPSGAQTLESKARSRVEGVAAERRLHVETAFEQLLVQDSVRRSEAAKGLLSWYHAEGFLRTAIEPTWEHSGDSAKASLVLIVREGPRAFVRRVGISGNENIPQEQLVRAMSVIPGDAFSVSAQERDIANLLKICDDAGYPFASIRVDRMSVIAGSDAESVDVDLHLSEGVRATVSRITAEGNTKTRTDVLVRESRLSEGDLFTPRTAAQVRWRLTRMNLFARVEEPELFLAPGDRVGVLLKVVEGSANRFDGVVGYVPRSTTGSGGGYLTGLMHVQFRNLFGTARDLALRWYRETERSQESSLRYHEPWIFGSPVDADFMVDQRRQDSTYVRFRFGLTADAVIADEWRAGASVERVTVIPSEPYGKRVLPDGSTLDIGARLRFDSRDDVVTPTSGGLYETSLKIGIKRAAYSDGREQRFETRTWTFDAAWYVSPFSRQVFLGALHAYERRTPSLDLSDLVRIGGASTLRGYREGQFAGTRLIWGGFEYRYLAGERSFLYAFIDAGLIALPGGNSIGFSDSQQTCVGYGGGIRVDSPAGLIGVSLALGEGDTFSTAKLHVRLINEF